MTMSWNDVKDGYGLEAVPKSMSNMLSCCICHATKMRLFTDQPIASDGTMTGNRKMIDNLKDKCFCKAHAVWYYK